MSRCCSCMLPQPSVCRTQITSADLAELLYIQGLDVNLCEKFAPIANILQFRDCLGNIISANSQIVTCAQYANQLCDTLATLASGGAVTLGVTQVVGADCNTYVIPETPFTAIDTTTIDFTTSGAFGHTLTGIVRISVDAGNIIEVHPDGLYVPTPETACAQITSFPAGSPVILGSTPVIGADCQTHVIPETPLTVVDSTSIDFSNSGAFGHILTGDVKISNQAGNQTTIQPDGLYTPATPPTVLGVADTNCINLSISGLPGSQVITADPIISPTAGNILQCTGNGLYVSVCAQLAGLTNVGPAVPGQTLLVGKDCLAYTIPVSPAETPLTVIDTSCIDLTTSGVANHTLQANLVISGAPGNIAQCTPLGLFVPDTGVDVDIQVVDTPCLNLSVSEAPVGTFTISGTPTVSPVAGNVLQCTAQGLYVPTPSSPLSFADTNCINFDQTGNIVSASPILSSTYPGYGTPCNGLQCTATGLATPPDVAGSTATVIGQELTSVAAVEGEADSQLDITLNIVNPSSCRNAILHITHRVAQNETAATGTGVGQYQVAFQAVHQFNLPGVLVTGFFVLTSMQTNDRTIPATSMPGGDEYAQDISFDFIVPPNFVGTYTARNQYLVSLATGDPVYIHIEPTVIHYTLVTI